MLSTELRNLFCGLVATWLLVFLFRAFQTWHLGYWTARSRLLTLTRLRWSKSLALKHFKDSSKLVQYLPIAKSQLSPRYPNSCTRRILRISRMPMIFLSHWLSHFEQR